MWNWMLETQFQEIKTEAVIAFDGLLNTAMPASLVPVGAGAGRRVVLL